MTLSRFLEISSVTFLNLFLSFTLKVTVGWFVSCLNSCLADPCLISEPLNFTLSSASRIVKLA